jgi:methionine aminotransferase
MYLNSKLPTVGTTIFTVMSNMANEYGAINLSQGFPDFEPDHYLLDLATQYLHQGKNQYAPMTGVPLLRERLSEKFNGLYQIDLHEEQEITITAGGTQGIFTVISTLVRPGDEVIYFEPAYDSYRPSIELCGGIAKPIILEGPDYEIDWNLVRKMFTAQTKLIIINTPNNPTGRIWSSNDMQNLQQLLMNTEVFLLSDEVYEHLIYDGKRHESILKYPDLRERGFAVFSFGKTYHVTGWKIGYVIAPPQLTKEFRKVHQFNVFSVNTPLQFALADYLEDPGQYLKLNIFYQEKRDYFLQLLAGTGLKPLSCEGTYFQCCEYSHLSKENDVEFTKWLVKEIGVAAVPLSSFYHQPPDARIIRFCFAKKEETLTAAGERLKKLR